MRRLLPDPAGPADPVEVYALPPGPHVRANMVVSADGAAVIDGSSRGLGGPADTALLGLLRSLADVVVVGAGTARTEGYRGLRVRPARVAARVARGQAEVPVLALVSASGDVTGIPAAEGPVLLLTTAAGSARSHPPHVEVVVAGESRVEPGLALDALHARGLTAVLTEGGPTWLADVVAADRLDELCLTVSPLLAGGAGPRLLSGAPVGARGLTLASVLEDEGTLFLRYTRT